MGRHFDIEALRTITVASDLGSFSRAAVQLGRSQSAVSMQLKRLEEEAGRPLFERKGRALIPTEAGDSLLIYARRIVAMHDEAASALSNFSTVAPAIRLGLPQDFFDDVMPEALAAFAEIRPNAHVDVRAGRNFALEEEVKAGRLDVALAFSSPGHKQSGELLACMPLFWFGGAGAPSLDDPAGVPLVLFNHPCLFRQAALQSLDAAGMRWRLALTTPSLAGVWAALRFRLGVTVRTKHAVPAETRVLDQDLPRLPALELRILTGTDLSAAASDFVMVLKSTCERLITSGPSS